MTLSPIGVIEKLTGYFFLDGEQRTHFHLCQDRIIHVMKENIAAMDQNKERTIVIMEDLAAAVP